MDEQDIQVSVVIPAFNNAATIGRAIDSVLAQTHPVGQILVIDDGSTDATGSLLSRYRERIEYFRQSNAGPGAARNKGIREATKPWIAFLDADDEWMPDHLEKQVRMLQTHPELAWVTGNFFRSDSQGRSGTAFENQGNQGPDTMSFFSAFVRNRWGCTDTMLIRRQVFDKVGMFEGEHRIAEDLDLWFRIALEYPQIGIVHEPLAVYHLDTPGSLIKSQSQEVGPLAEFLSRNLQRANERGMAAEFRPCAALLLKKWIRGMLFSGQGRKTKALTDSFGYLLPFYFRMLAWVGARCPRFTASCLQTISRGARSAGLRRGAARTASSS
jgi:glycosyltransferase involved in cell wall biosynthesis